ncbi:hypothetical protein MNBD_GAMMA11-1663 [hydrothermal vent metagenome]|uniref:Uncharacterized protein n=1 Tax=hydrothermal vent metagenome TaxID=652676 RepID=A0A3B0XCU5_9ZZZZ
MLLTWKNQLSHESLHNFLIHYAIQINSLHTFSRQLINSGLSERINFDTSVLIYSNILKNISLLTQKIFELLRGGCSDSMRSVKISGKIKLAAILSLPILSEHGLFNFRVIFE